MASSASALHVPQSEIPFPADWKWERLDDLCQGVFDCPHSTPALVANGPFVVRSQDIRAGIFRCDEAARVSEETYRERIARAEPRHGDLLYSREGTYFGIAAEVPRETQVCLGQRMVLIRPDPTAIYHRYLRYWLNSPLMASHVHGFRDGSVAERLNMPTIRNLPIAYPPLREQRAIAHILGTLDDKIELNRRMNETLEAMARTLFKSWFVDFDPVRAKAEKRHTGLPALLADLFPDALEASELGEIPKSWRIDPVGEHMLNFDSKRVPVSGAERAKRRGSHPYHGAAGVMDYIDDYLFDGIYLLVGEDGSVIQGNGRAVTQHAWGKFWVNNHAHVLQGRGSVSTAHLYLYFQFEPVLPYVTGAVQPKLSQGRMNTMPFVFAGEKICQAFDDVVRPCFAKYRLNVEASGTLAALRDTLLPKLISGELRLREAEHLVGSVA